MSLSLLQRFEALNSTAPKVKTHLMMDEETERMAREIAPLGTKSLSACIRLAVAIAYDVEKGEQK